MRMHGPTCIFWANLTAFSLEDRTRVILERAQGYAEDRSTPSGFAVDTMWNFDVAGDGQVYTTVEDLCRWDQRFMDGSEAGAFFELMHERGLLNSGDSIDYALGISHGEYRGATTVSHGGAWGGFRANLCRYPTQHLSIAVTCNSGEMQPEAISQGLADIFLT